MAFSYLKLYHNYLYNEGSYFRHLHKDSDPMDDDNNNRLVWEQ
jgi:hypothetical protein